MKQKVFLIHGWSVQETTTYQAFHTKLAENGFDLQEVYLGRYVSLEDDIEIRDIAKALHRALHRKLNGDWGRPFHIVTHSTGALIAKQWIVHHYKGRFAEKKPLKNIVFLAGPHFGSRLAHHGRSMMAQARYRGETGQKVLEALELGSAFSWQINEAWLDPASWKKKGIRPFNLIGDKVRNDRFKSRIFPAGYEQGSDMVVRVPAGNSNFKLFSLSAGKKKLNPVGSIEGVPFAALKDFTHSGDDLGIMNSITSNSTPHTHLGLKLILQCLRVRTKGGYQSAYGALAGETRRTRRVRPGFAQLDFRFRDDQGAPIDDYVFKLGAIKNGREVPSRTIAHTHKNKNDPGHFTVFINLKELEPRLVYFIEFDADSGSDLFQYKPDPYRATVSPHGITEIITEDQTTQLDVTLSREPSENLFVFHRGDDPKLHVRWNRAGKVTSRKPLKYK